MGTTAVICISGPCKTLETSATGKGKVAQRSDEENCDLKPKYDLYPFLRKLKRASPHRGGGARASCCEAPEVKPFSRWKYIPRQVIPRSCRSLAHAPHWAAELPRGEEDH